MSGRVEQASRWMYRGLWGVLTRWFRVPDQPPTLPAGPDDTVESFRPAPGFLRYMKLGFWIFFVVFDLALLVAWVALTVNEPTVGIVAAPVALVIAIVPDIVGYLAIHLRYDTTWYVMTDRSLRIRRGIWTIHETTITFENVQNVTVNQGPIQRLFGIANVLVETAGGGGGANQGAHGEQSMAPHRGLIEGVADAPRIRDLILSRLRESQSAGLGDEDDHDEPTSASPTTSQWSPEHIATLREIRDRVRELVSPDE